MLRVLTLTGITFLGLCFGLTLQAERGAAAGPPCDTPGVIVADPLGQTLLLTMDCEASHAVLVPPGKTLDGNGHRITAVEPLGGTFAGAVVQNAVAPSTIHVTNLTIDAQLDGNP